MPVFLNEENPVITIGLAMTAANLLLGLAGFTHFLSYPFIKIVASFTGLAPLLGALNISNKHLTSNLTNEEPGRINKTGIILSVIAFSAAAYFSGGLWFRVIMPLFYSRWPEVIGLDSFIYAVFYFALALYARKFSYIWLGPVALSLLGLGLATVIIGLDRPVETIITLLLLIAGLCATDLYYWLTLRGLTKMLNCRKVFGLGLGVSLFFITAPGIALDVQLLPSPLSSSTTAVFGACLLFIINPLIIWFLRPLQQYEQDKNVSLNNFDEKNRGGNDVKAGDDKLDREIPAFWYDLTNTEKKVYELIYNGCTDSEISEKLVISRHTVKFHVRNILRKSGTSNRKELLQIVKASK
ncbi:helix-turn-helix transcriptional regulator [Pelotomaculum isophthalicicum JI]|uniref:Helix-turn-helix transcriptional regulator n=1 Tax=Pelotomaculum isophthalicicum JI TaxID=947010 RepID=A0A9X4H083_9FIRM|nr:helix-turn-helix transcriptional regulator [Pelotomaculum isophthalicicum]MDF9409605.1 helix-turn-helix transcriptional regulator [Pelotomaculum isophthalicicum JI]